MTCIVRIAGGLIRITPRLAVVGSTLRARVAIGEHLSEALEALKGYQVLPLPYVLGQAFARLTGGRIVKPRRPPKVESVPGRVY